MLHASGLSRARRVGAAAVIALLALLDAGPSRAQDAVPLDEHTALMVGQHNLKLGVLAFEYGVTRNFSFGVNAPYFVAGVVSPLFAPNLHLELDRLL